MRTAVAIPVPHGPVNEQWVEQVNSRAGRAIVRTLKVQDTWLYCTTTPTQSVVKPGQLVLIIEAVGSTVPPLYQIVDRLETVL